MLTYDQALQHVLETVKPLAPVMQPLPEASGLILAQSVAAPWDMPRCDNSAMDGFAVAAPLDEASGPLDEASSPLEIVGASYAGHPFVGAVASGQAVRITTGASIPEGCNSVIPLEDASDQKTHVALSTPVQHGQHVRHQGEEFKVGETLLQAGTQLNAGEIGLLACAGVEHVLVYPKPRVAIISSGDELVELGQTPEPGQIINSNLYLLMTRLRECGCLPFALGIGQDNPAALNSLIAEGMKADLLISTGGVSVGERDQMHNTLAQRGFQQKFWKVAIKPGKPVLFGALENKPYFGLPGNPAAAAATFELFVKPALNLLRGNQEIRPPKRTGVLTSKVSGGGRRQSFLWCHLEWIDEEYKVTVPTRQGSGQHRSIQGANALLSIPIETEQLLAGEKVEVLLLE
ncbi:MAG: molybdopterin molybdotransferase MoeA [Desulfuromonadales bacterium]|nr:molybdopterin molybdotransferase MoeA [Desulfuromonadales bacterium]